MSDQKIETLKRQINTNYRVKRVTSVILIIEAIIMMVNLLFNYNPATATGALNIVSVLTIMKPFVMLLMCIVTAIVAEWAQDNVKCKKQEIVDILIDDIKDMVDNTNLDIRCQGRFTYGSHGYVDNQSVIIYTVDEPEFNSFIQLVHDNSSLKDKLNQVLEFERVGVISESATDCHDPYGKPITRVEATSYDIKDIIKIEDPMHANIKLLRQKYFTRDMPMGQKLSKNYISIHNIV